LSSLSGLHDLPSHLVVDEAHRRQGIGTDPPDAEGRGVANNAYSIVSPEGPRILSSYLHDETRLMLDHPEIRPE